MSLDGCWQFDASHEKDRAEGDGCLKGDVCWAADLSWLMELVRDLDNADRSSRRLSFTAPPRISWDYKSSKLEYIPFRVRPNGEIQSGRRCNRSGKNYQRNYRYRWRPTGWKITERGLCLIDPKSLHGVIGMTEHGVIVERAFPEHVVDWIQSLHADTRATLVEHGKIMHSCSLCGKPIAPGYGIGPECTELVESSPG